MSTQDPQKLADELLTLADCVRWGASHFNAAGLYFGHGTDNALDEALVLALHALHLPPALPERYFDSRLTREERLRVLDLLLRRINERQPAAYLTGEAWFAGLPFYVDERVLVPRSPLAELIEQGFEPWLHPGQVTRVLDIGTGSGCIAIACALAFPGAQVDAADIDAGALEVAWRNIERHEAGEWVHTVQSDVYAALDGQRYDLIISNPPYVPAASMAGLPAEYGREPAAALEAGEDGLDVVRRILAGAPDHLEDGGLLVVEVGEAAPWLEALCAGLPLTWLDFERGGDGVFLLTADEVRDYADHLRSLANPPN